MEKHLLFFDIDGTLVHRGDVMYPADIAAIRAARAAGHEVYVNSGRSRAAIYPFITDAVAFDGFVCGSTYIERHGEILHRVLLSRETVQRVCDYCIARKIPVILEGEKEIYALCGGCFHRGVDLTDEYPAVLDRTEELALTKVTFGAPIPREDIALFSGLRIINFERYAEGICEGYDKAFGMKLLCEKLGVPQANVVAFGDSANDIEMLRFAKKSVVMHKAPADLSDVAAYRADDDTDGIAAGIAHFGLGC